MSVNATEYYDVSDRQSPDDPRAYLIVRNIKGCLHSSDTSICDVSSVLKVHGNVKGIQHVGYELGNILRTKANKT